MKKILLRITLVALFATTIFSANAQNYKHSAGIVVGTMEGLSYKGFISNNLAIQADLVFKVLPTAGTSTLSTKFYGEYGTSNWSEPITVSSSFTGWSFEANPNLLYQSQITDFDECTLYWYAGGGVSLGLGREFSVGQEAGVDGKWGLNAIGGVELAFDIPLAIFLDFRPGYGMYFTNRIDRVPGLSTHTRGITNFFDWGLGLGARYCF